MAVPGGTCLPERRLEASLVTEGDVTAPLRPRDVAPKVSVVIPAYNAASYLELAIDSVAKQTLDDLEVIVVDDASTDGTAEKARKLLAERGLRHKVVTLAVNGGPSVARNSGVALASGEYVAFLDADDEWLPKKLALQVALMSAHPQVTLCGCQADWVDAAGQLFRPLYRDLPTLLPDGWKLLLWNCYVATPCAMARRLDLGIRPFDTRLRVGEDRDLWIRLASNGAVGLVNQKLVVIKTLSGGFMTKHATLVAQHTMPMIRKHLAAFADSLGPRDRMRALGLLHSQIGKSLGDMPGQYLLSARHLLTAMFLGYRPRDSMRQLIFTLPIVRDLKPYVRAWLGA